MQRLGDDVVGLILNRLGDSNDRKSFSQVCKQWLRVEGLQRSSLRVFESDLLLNFLPRFPNLVTFETSSVITNSHLEFVAKTCPNIQVLNLNHKETNADFDEFGDTPGLDSIDDWGIRVIASACPNLIKVCLRRRWTIGNLGVISLVNSARCLTSLDVRRCKGVGDEALKAIANADSLRVLNLQSCCLITDAGLASLARGSVSWTLRKLVIAECDRITDVGVFDLRQMWVLEELDLADCGPEVTDTGGLAIAAITPLRRLNLSWLINISDATVVALAQNCKNLVTLDLTGCEAITDGIRAFASHESLEALLLASCHNLIWDDIEHTMLGCQTLRYIVLDKRFRMWIPMTMQENIYRLAWR